MEETKHHSRQLIKVEIGVNSFLLIQNKSMKMKKRYEWKQIENILYN